MSYKNSIYNIWKKIRKPLPKKTGGYHTSKKGKKGYDRKRDKKDKERGLGYE